MERKDYICLFGENNSLTCNNNSFYFWEQVVNNEDGIQKYFILQKNKYNKKAIKNIEKSKRKNIDNVHMDFLSMGMTGDYEVAVEEGATFVRVGTGIFGERSYRITE